jgi:hypothetical protein
MAVVVVLLLPFGVIFRRLGGGVYAHGIWQVLALCAMLCGFGLGIRLAQMRALVSFVPISVAFPFPSSHFGYSRLGLLLLS